MQAINSLAVGALVVTANYLTLKPIYLGVFDKPTKREFQDLNTDACIGDPLKFHEHGEQSGCPVHVRYAPILVNLATQRDEQVWLCTNHFLQIQKLDSERLQTHRWQDLPFPRWAPDKQLYGTPTLVHDPLVH